MPPRDRRRARAAEEADDDGWGEVDERIAAKATRKRSIAGRRTPASLWNVTRRRRPGHDGLLLAVTAVGSDEELGPRWLDVSVRGYLRYAGGCC